MKISELVGKLDVFKKEYGYLEVYIPDSDYGVFPDFLKLDTIDVEDAEANYVDLAFKRKI